jgi:hypothetical protein
LNTMWEIIEGICKGEYRGGRVVDMEALYTPIIKKLISQNRMQEAVLYERSAFGGNCLRCGVDYKKISEPWNGRFTFEYYEPACTCFPHCPSCGRSLFIEMELGEKGCSHCLYVKCVEVSDVSIFNEKARKNVTKRVECGGIMTPIRGGFRCEKCNTIRSE